MRRRQVSALSGVAAAALALTLAPASATAVTSPDTPEKGTAKHDDLPNPLGDAQRDLQREALSQLVTGKARTTTVKGNRVIEMKGEKGKKSKYVSYPVKREEDIFTILVDFGDKAQESTGGTAGPVHNQIPEPDRSENNSTAWSPNYDRQHYLDMMFGSGESFKDFYLKQSNGRFLAKGDVSDWVKVPYNEARYGSNEQSDSAGYWPFIEDTAQAWYDDQKASGKSDTEIADYLKQFDKVDRYDYDGDGNFNEPDGYIDHFQAIHAGEGEEAGGGAQGDDAIWSHRWYVNSSDIEKTGPEDNKAGGTQIGNTGIWIGDYTTEPENGGLGVFTHEFGHDLGLPDLYDTQGGDNGTGFWTLMSAGSWLNHGGQDIGTTPGYLGAWEKAVLGWLDYDVVPYGENTTLTVGPADRVVLDKKANEGRLPQAVVVPLPEREYTVKYNTPHSGTGEWWGGSADNLSSTMRRSLDLTGATSAQLTAWMQYQIETGYDFLYAEVSTNGGSSWTQVGDAITGRPSGWAQKSFDLSPWAGQKIDFRFRYATDGGLHYAGPFIDDLALTLDGTTAWTDDVESGAGAWTAAGGFEIISGSITKTAQDMYIAENRVYSGYDDTLRTGPYNFGFTNTKPDWVERFPYQNGLLVWFGNGQYTDNNTSAHPGGGLILPVDARPAPVTFPDGSMLANRRQPFDATFGTEKTDAVTFHRNGVPVTVPSTKGIPTFDDSNPNRYWTADNPWGSTKVAGSGTSITVDKSMKHGDQLQVSVRFR